MRTQTVVGLLVTALAVVAGWAIARGLESDSSAGANVRPFTALVKESRIGADGKAGLVEYSLRARRRDGSTVWGVLTDGPDNKTILVKSVTDIQSRATTGVDPLTQSIVRTPLSDRQIKHLGIQNHACSDEPNPEQRVFHGVVAVKVETKIETSPGRLYRFVSWKSPELGCLELLAEGTLNIPNGPVFRTTREVILLLTGEPSEDIFDIPHGYSERRPSEVLAERQRVRPELGCRSAACSESAALLDQAHEARRRVGP